MPFIFFILMASAFMEKGTMQSIFSAIGDLFSIFTGKETLESVLTDDTPPEERWAIEREALDMMHEEMATALGMSTDDFKELLTYGDDLNTILQQNEVDTGAITMNQLKQMKNDPEQLRSLLFNDGVINGLLKHEKLGPFMVKQMFTNPKLAETALGGMDDLSDKSKGVLLEAIRAGHIDQAALNDLLKALEQGNDPQTLIRERILTLLPEEQQGALIMSVLSTTESAKQFLEANSEGIDWENTPLSLEDTAAYLSAQRENIENILGQEGLSYVTKPENINTLIDMTDFQTFLNSQQSAELLDIIKQRAANGNTVETALSALIQEAPIDRFRGKTEEEKAQMKAYGVIASSLISASVESDPNTSTLDRALALSPKHRETIFGIMSGDFDFSNMPAEVGDVIKDINFRVLQSSERGLSATEMALKEAAKSMKDSDNEMLSNASGLISGFAGGVKFAPEGALDGTMDLLVDQVLPKSEQARSR